MARELRDELEVPGHVLSIETITNKEAVDEIRLILDHYENQGFNSINEIPENKDKEKIRKLLRALGQDVQF